MYVLVLRECFECMLSLGPSQGGVIRHACIITRAWEEEEMCVNLRKILLDVHTREIV